jgi:hypothetical protein
MHQAEYEYKYSGHLARKPRYANKWAVITFALLIASAGSIFITLHKSHHTPASNYDLPESIVKNINNFHPYYFAASVSGFSLVHGSVNFQNGVLVFSMKNSSGDTLAISEEATPAGYDISSLTPDKQFNTPAGQAFISDNPDGTVGTLFTNDNTWVLINAPYSIGADEMQQVLNGLKRST